MAQQQKCATVKHDDCEFALYLGKRIIWYFHFPAFDNKAKRSVELRHSTRNASAESVECGVLILDSLCLLGHIPDTALSYLFY